MSVYCDVRSLVVCNANKSVYCIILKVRSQLHEKNIIYFNIFFSVNIVLNRYTYVNSLIYLPS